MCPSMPIRILGSYVANRVSDKISPVHDRIFCCRSGTCMCMFSADRRMSMRLDVLSTMCSVHMMELLACRRSFHMTRPGVTHLFVVAYVYVSQHMCRC